MLKVMAIIIHVVSFQMVVVLYNYNAQIQRSFNDSGFAVESPEWKINLFTAKVSYHTGGGGGGGGNASATFEFSPNFS